MDLYKKFDPKQDKVNMSYIEIYNENIRDLLTEKDENLDLLYKQNGGVHIQGLTENTSLKAKDILKSMQKGNLKRMKNPTNANAESSRSHAILQIEITRTFEAEHKQKGQNS